MKYNFCPAKIRFRCLFVLCVFCCVEGPDLREAGLRKRSCGVCCKSQSAWGWVWRSSRICASRARWGGASQEASVTSSIILHSADVREGISARRPKYLKQLPEKRQDLSYHFNWRTSCILIDNGVCSRGPVIRLVFISSVLPQPRWWRSREYLHMFQSRIKLCRLGLVARVALSLGCLGRHASSTPHRPRRGAP